MLRIYKKIIIIIKRINNIIIVINKKYSFKIKIKGGIIIKLIDIRFWNKTNYKWVEDKWDFSKIKLKIIIKLILVNIFIKKWNSKNLDYYWLIIIRAKYKR